MKYKIYISGAIKNNPNYIRDFNKAKERLEKLGFEVLSPLDTYAHKNNLSVKMCMFESLDLLRKADLFTIITDSVKSRGVNIERDLALYCNIPYINYFELKEATNEKEQRGKSVGIS